MVRILSQRKHTNCDCLPLHVRQHITQVQLQRVIQHTAAEAAAAITWKAIPTHCPLLLNTGPPAMTSRSHEVIRSVLVVVHSCRCGIRVLKLLKLMFRDAQGQHE
jgi:hypothetical protein